MKEGGEAIDWNQEFWVPAQIPIINNQITMKLMDEDTVTDETVGSIIFDLKDIIANSGKSKKQPFIWKNVYGSPVSRTFISK